MMATYVRFVWIVIFCSKHCSEVSNPGLQTPNLIYINLNINLLKSKYVQYYSCLFLYVLNGTACFHFFSVFVFFILNIVYVYRSERYNPLTEMLYECFSSVSYIQHQIFHKQTVTHSVISLKLYNSDKTFFCFRKGMKCFFFRDLYD